MVFRDKLAKSVGESPNFDSWCVEDIPSDRLTRYLHVCSDEALREVLLLASAGFDKNLEFLDNGIAAIGRMRDTINEVLKNEFQVSSEPLPLLALVPDEAHLKSSISTRATIRTHRSDPSPVILPCEKDIPEFRTHSSRTRSFSPGPILQEDKSQIMNREDVFSDEDDSMPIAALEPSLEDVFGVKLMCADVVSKPARKEVTSPAVDSGLMDDYPPLFIAPGIQAESSEFNIAAFLATRSCVSPDIIPYAEVQNLLKRGEDFSPDSRTGPVNSLSTSDSARIQNKSMNLVAHSDQEKSFSSESIPRRVVLPLKKRNRFFLDEDVSFPIAPLQPPAIDVSGVKRVGVNVVQSPVNSGGDLNAEEIQAESMLPNLITQLAPRSCGPPGILRRSAVQQVLELDKELPPGLIDDLPIFDQAEIQNESPLLNITPHSARRLRRSFTPEDFRPMPSEDKSRLMNREALFFDEDDEMPIVPLEPLLDDVFDGKLMCAELVSELGRKEVISPAVSGLMDDYPLFIAAEIQAEASEFNIAAFLATRSCVSPDILPYAEVQRLLKRNKEPPLDPPRTGLIGDLPLSDPAGTQNEFSLSNLDALCSQLERSSSPPIPRRVTRPLKKRNRAFLDDDVSLPIAPPKVSVVDAFDTRLMRADVVSEPRRKEVIVRFCVSSDNLWNIDAGQTLRQDEDISPGPHATPVDECLPIFDPGEIQGGSPFRNLTARCGHRKSFSPEEFQPIASEEISLLMKKGEGLLDDDDSLPIAPHEPSLNDVFGMKLMCADVVSHPRR